MKSLFRFVSVVVLFLFFAPMAQAQSDQKREISVEVNYLGGDLKTQFSPVSPGVDSFISGKKHELNGLQFFGRVGITDRVAIAGRVEENFLRRPRFFMEGQAGKDENQSGYHYRSEPDWNLKDAHLRYQEVFASVALPKTAGHRLIAGVARTAFSQQWRFTVTLAPMPPLPGVAEMKVNGLSSGDDKPSLLTFKVKSRLNISAIGPMVGVEGGKEVKGLGLNWSGRVYPRMARMDRGAVTFEPAAAGERGELEKPLSSSTHGFELRGTVSYWLASQVAITGGYQYRRLFQPNPLAHARGFNRVLNEIQIENGFIGGIRLMF